MTTTQYRDHIPQVPSWFKFLIIAKIIVAIVVLGLAAYGATFNDFFAGNGYAIFCAIAIFATEGYYLATTTFFTSLFNGWAYLILSIFQTVWWLACWANLASWASAYKLLYLSLSEGALNDYEECARSVSEQRDPSRDSDYGLDLDSYDDNLTNCITSKRKKHRDALAAVAGIGALEWILVIATLVIFALAVRRHKKAGATFSAGGAGPTSRGNPQGSARMHTESHQMYSKSEATV